MKGRLSMGSSLLVNQSTEIWKVFMFALGLVGALGLARISRGFLFEVEPTDPLTFVLVAAVLGFAALVACFVPARRAVRVDPMIALRAE